MSGRKAPRPREQPELSSEWRMPVLGLVAIGLFLLCGGGFKLSAGSHSSGYARKRALYVKRQAAKRRAVAPAPVPVVPVGPRKLPPPSPPQGQTSGVDTGPGSAERVELLTSEDAAVRSFAASTLATLRPVQAETIKALCDALRADEDPIVRSAAATALSQLGQRRTDITNALYRAQRDPNPAVQKAVREALTRLGRRRY